MIHLIAILNPSIPVCREEMAESDRLGSEREGDCPKCLDIRSGGSITKMSWSR